MDHSKVGRFGLQIATIIWRAYSRARRMPVLPLIFLAMIVVCAIFASVLAPYDPAKIDLPSTLQGPSLVGGHLLGTDHLGRDVLSRLIHGSTITLIVGVLTVTWAAFLGTSLGILSGYFGGMLDAIIMRTADIVLGLPVILLALVIVAIIGPGLSNVIIILVVTSWAQYARVMRGEVLRIKEKEFIALAIIAGSSRTRILLKHVFPNIINTLLILATLQVGTVILIEAALSFLGLGVPPPTSSWGLMASEGRTYISSAWWLVTFPGIAIMLTVLSTNLLGDWFRDYLDPLLRQV